MQRTILAFCLMIAFTPPSVNAIVFAEAPEQTMQSVLAEAAAAQASGDFRSAAESYRKATELEPSIPELWANLGLMYHAMGERSEAIQSFRQAIKLNSSLFVPQLFLGIEYLEMQKPDAAIPFLENAVKLNPKDPQAELSLAKAYSMKGQGDLAADFYWRSTKMTPNDGKAWFGLGMAYLQQVDTDARIMTGTYKDSKYNKLRAGELFAEQGKLVEAARAYKDAVSVASPLPCSHAGYGIVLLRQNALAEAKEEFDRESNSNSGCPLTSLGLAALQLIQGDTENSLRELLAIWKADPGFLQESLPLLHDGISAEQTEKLLGLAKDWQADNKTPAGFVDSIQAGLQSDAPISATLTEFGADNPGTGPDAAPPLTQDSEKFFKSGQFRKCSETLRPRLSVLPERYLLILAPCAFFTGDYRTASLAARRLATFSASRQTGLYWESKADQRLAIAALTRAGEIDANSPRMHVLLGDIYRQKRRWGAAESEYRKALVLKPEDHSGRLGLAIALFEDGNSEEAFATDKDLLQKNPEDPEANLLAGEILVQQHQYAGAESYLNKVQGTKPEFMPRLHALLGEVYANTDRIPEALAEFKLGIASDEDGSIHFQMARLYQKTGDKKAAAEAFQASQQLRKQWDDRASVALQQLTTDISRQ